MFAYARFLIPLFLAGILVAAAVTPVGPAAAREIPSSTFVVGDSITAQSRAELKRLHPRWDVNGLGGRPVSRLPLVLARRLAAGPAPRRVVVALGSNAARGWTRADYEAALALLPASTTVLFVTLRRDPLRYPEAGPHRARPSVMRAYSHWMREIAAERPRTCVFEWRRKVKRHPELLRDGVHPTAQGRRIWARGVSRSLSECGLTAPTPQRR